MSTLRKAFGKPEGDAFRAGTAKLTFSQRDQAAVPYPCLGFENSGRVNTAANLQAKRQADAKKNGSQKEAQAKATPDRWRGARVEEVFDSCAFQGL